MKKVFVFDIDGTLLNKNHIIHKDHITSFEKAIEKGHEIVLCSGRSLEDIFRFLKQVPKGYINYAICNNGAYIYDFINKKILIDQEIDHSFIEEFEKIGKKYNALFSVATTKRVKRGSFERDYNMENTKTLPEEWRKDLFINDFDLISLFKEEQITQLSYFLVYKEEYIESVKKDLEKLKVDNLNIHISGGLYIDINPKNVSKMTGIDKLAKILNIDTNNFIAFGDSGNDIQMLKGVGLGIAMENGTKEAKEAADIIIGDHNTNAISQKIIELI